MSVFKILRQAALMAVVFGSMVCSQAWAAGPIGDKDTMINSGNEPSAENNGCIDAKVFSTKLLSGVCWECILPIIIGSQVIKSDMSGWFGQVPDDAAKTSLTSAMCLCWDNNGIPSIGIRNSMWEPFRLVEFERMSGCSSVLAGVRFPFDKLNQAVDNTHWVTRGQEASTVTKRHYHYYSYPLLTMLQMWVPRNCNPGFFSDLDVMYMSEIDPTWNYDEIAFFTHPEAALIASPFGVLACLPDSFMAQIGKPVNSLFWCAGSWGVVFPTAGHTGYNRSLLESSSLMAARVLYALHRRGVEWRTMGKESMCGGHIAPYLPKNQYRFSMFHPIAETNGNHGLGQNTLLWGIGRIIPMTGEDPVMIIWRWIDCCNTYAA